MLLRDHWYVACPESKLPANQPKAVQIGDLELVVYRDSKGQPHALLDRCCHRGVRLSLGRITEDRIACGYHGWQYDPDGAIAHVPSLGKGEAPPKRCVPSFQAAARDHYVWVWIAGEHELPTYEPGMPVLRDVGGSWFQKTQIWNVALSDAIENQLDFAHTAFAHPGTYPGHEIERGCVPALSEIQVECRLENGGVEAFLPTTPANDAAVPHWRELTGWLRFELPTRNYVFLTAQRAVGIYNWVPLSEHQCRLEFLGTGDAAIMEPADGVNRRVTYYEPDFELLDQDKALLESANRWIQAGRQTFEVSVAGDYPQLLTRKICRAAVAGRAVASANVKPRRYRIVA
jgi:nitrite reductase/ring-hydroxylating ferredoxin subunit